MFGWNEICLSTFIAIENPSNIRLITAPNMK